MFETSKKALPKCSVRLIFGGFCFGIAAGINIGLLIS